MNLFKINKAKSILSLLAVVIPLTAFSQPHQDKQFGLNAPFNIADLPAGHVVSKLDALPDVAKQRALRWMHSFSFTDQDLEYLQVDNNGGVLYSDTYLPDEGSGQSTAIIDQIQAISAADAFTLHSKPGAANVVYLDFDGHVITGTSWNTYVSGNTYNAKPYDTDGYPSNFSPTELSKIAEIWHRIAEDYSPFDIDVTTQEPVSFGPKAGRILITQNVDAYGKNMPFSNAGGVAYVNVWDTSNFDYYSPALVYYNNLDGGHPVYVAEAASHELGHNMGLGHDGTSSDSYYLGHGTGFVSWAPIMGAGYYQNVTQWSKGEYLLANQKQDDTYLIGRKLTFRPDQHGNTSLTASILSVDAAGNITATNPETDPHNINQNNKGIIETRSDVDYFSFDTGAGSININVTPAWESFYRTSNRGANLDVQVILYSSRGVLLAKNDPLNETDASISATVPPGHYYLAISGVGNTVTPYSDYGSLGEYFISGTVIPGNDYTAPKPDPITFSVEPYAVNSSSISMVANTATDPSGQVQYRFVCAIAGNGCLNSPWQDSNAYTASGLRSGTKFTFQVQAKDPVGNLTRLSIAKSATTVAVVPSTPTLTGAKYSSSVVLNWNPSTDSRGYEIFRCAVQGTECVYGQAPLKTVTATTSTFTYIAGTSYGYKVRAINPVYKSAFSNEVRF